MYENFLLQSDAIATVLSSEDPNRAAPLTSSDVLEWLATNASSVKYFGRDIPLPDHNTIEFSRYVDGAQLLDDLFSSLSECRVAYDKVRHGRQLTLTLADIYPVECQEIVAFISSILRS